MELKFKKIALCASVMLGISLTASGHVTVPNEFREIEGKRNVQLFSDGNENYVIYVDISSGARLEHKFGQESKGLYRRFPIERYALGNAFAMVNGGFFNFSRWYDSSMAYDFKRISFPATPGLTAWGSTGENTRTLCIKGNRRAVVDKTGTATRNYSYACKFSVTLLDPSVNKDKDSAIGRTYIGVSRDNREVLFFISNAKTQNQMINLLARWGIPDYHMIQGDGSYSAQFVTTRAIGGAIEQCLMLSKFMIINCFLGIFYEYVFFF